MVNNRNKTSRGFTILELLISVSIMAVLAAMVLALSDTIRRKAEQAACVGNMRSLFAALSAYNTDNGHFPQAPNSSDEQVFWDCLLYTSPSPRDATLSRMPSSA